MPEVGPFDLVHPDVARALAAKSGMERLRLAHEAWALARDRLTAFLGRQHPEWAPAEVRRQVARRLGGGSAEEWARRLGVDHYPMRSSGAARSAQR